MVGSGVAGVVWCGVGLGMVWGQCGMEWDEIGRDGMRWEGMHAHTWPPAAFPPSRYFPGKVDVHSPAAPPAANGWVVLCQGGGSHLQGGVGCFFSGRGAFFRLGLLMEGSLFRRAY